MLTISTKLESATLLNIAEHMLKSGSSCIQQVSSLVDMLPISKNSWEIRLQLANCLLGKAKREQAKKVTKCIIPSEYLKNVANIGQVNLLLSVLIRTGKCDIVHSLMNSSYLFDRFSRFELLESRLRLANLLMLENNAEHAESLIREIDFTKLIENLKTLEQLGLVCDILIGLSKFDEIMYLFKFGIVNRRINPNSIKCQKIHTLNKLILQGMKEQALDILSKLEIETILNTIYVGLLAHTYTLLGMFDAANDAFEFGEREQLICEDFYTFKAILYRCIWQIDRATEAIQNQMKIACTARSLFWKAYLLKTCGQNDNSLMNFSKMLRIPLDQFMKSAVLTEIGNIHRSEFHFDKSIQFYNEAKISDRSPGNWRPYFEEALLLMSSGNYDDAREILFHGMTDRSSNENACSSLKLIIDHEIEPGKLTTADSNDLEITRKALSAKPYFPYAAYVSFIEANISYSKGNSEKAYSIIKNDICESQSLEPKQRITVLSYFENNRTVKLEKLSRYLSKGLWPFHTSDCFERFALNTLTCNSHTGITNW